MRPFSFYVTACLLISGAAGAEEEPKVLSESTYSPGKAIVFLFVNWGRAWRCGSFENAQLQYIAFAGTPLSDSTDRKIDLSPRSTLLSKDEWTRYAYVVAPGEYALAAFDLKVAASISDVRHLRMRPSDLSKDGKPTGGTFKAGAGEIVYIGNFWVDCTTPNPIPWRYFSVRNEFSADVSRFRKDYPFTENVPVHYRLLATEMIGEMHGVEEYVVE